MEEMLTVRTHLARGDIFRAVLARVARPAALLRTWGLWTLGVAALLAFGRGLPKDAIDVLVLGLSASAGALFSVVVSIGFVLLRVRRTLARSDGVLGEHCYRLTDEGLRETTSVNETLAGWSSIRGVGETGQFVVVELHSGSFHIIPRRCFDYTAQAAGFVSEVRRRVSGNA